MIITGFFCTWLATACLGMPHQTLVQPTPILPQCGPVLEVTRGGREVGAYVDDTVGASEASTVACAQSTGLPTYAGEFGVDQGLPGGLVEWYPVMDHTSRIGYPAPPGQAGYILQAFSWGDNLSDGEAMGRCTAADTPASCAAKYQAPSRRQIRAMWCHAIFQRPHVVLWYYAGGVPRVWIFRAMRRPCS